MPRTAHWVITDSNFIVRLRQFGYVNNQATLVRLDIRPQLPTAVYADTQGGQGAGTIVSTEQILAWMNANNITLASQMVQGVYIDTPRDLTLNLENGQLVLNGFLTDAFMTNQVANFLRNAPPIA